MHGLHVKLLGNFHTSFPDLTEFQNIKSADDIDLKNINISCLSKLLQKDVSSLLVKLQNLLCLFQQGKDQHNEELYKDFLKQLNIVLKDVGCSLDEVLQTKNFLEQITDNAGKIADRLVFEILKIADDLEITGQLLGVVCKILGKPLSVLSDTLMSTGFLWTL
ncbi:ranaspumin-like [Leptodactylus fuscus]